MQVIAGLACRYSLVPVRSHDPRMPEAQESPLVRISSRIETMSRE
jgi:hypothetical protein